MTPLAPSLLSGDPVTALQLVREQSSLHWALPLSSLHTAVLAAGRGQGEEPPGTGQEEAEGGWGRQGDGGGMEDSLLPGY